MSRPKLRSAERKQREPTYKIESHHPRPHTKVGERAMNISEDELDTAERNERRALDEVNRRTVDALEAAGWKDGEASPLSRDENVEHISVRDEDAPAAEGGLQDNILHM